VLLCLIPLAVHKSAMSLAALVVTTAVCSLPFYFAGTVLSGVITKQNLPMGKMYASDLLGASLGCLFVLFGLEKIDAPSLLIFSACFAALGGLCFAWHAGPRKYFRLSLLIFLALGVVGWMNWGSRNGIRPVIVKGRGIDFENNYFIERWNSFSRVAICYPGEAAPQYWGPSPVAPQRAVMQRWMNIDGEAGTVMCQFHDESDIAHLRYDLTNIGYNLGRKGKACVIGVGGGRDMHSAILFGYDQVTGVELNPIFVNVLKNECRDFTRIADRPGVTLVADEARSYLSRNPEKYAVIQMSLIDTWASTGAGAFTLSENCLYTSEAWHIFLDRLDDNGVFTVSRWQNPVYNETGRVLSLAVTALLSQGVEDPSRHIALFGTGCLATLLVSKQPFSQEELDKLAKTCEELKYDIHFLPGSPAKDPLLQQIVSAKNRKELETAAAGAELNYLPPTDESPYFFNMLKLRRLPAALARSPGVVHGNMIATITLVSLIAILSIFAFATIVVPLWLRSREEKLDVERTQWSGLLYFSLIGAGFMLTEIALVQRLSVVLSHPIYALGVLLFTLIASTGLGSLLSDKLPLTRKPWIYIYPLLTACSILGLRFLLSAIFAPLEVSPLSVRIAVSIAVLFPIGVLMGLFFPTGMKLAKEISASQTPWYWAVNGIFGVLCSALAVFISIYLGISTNFYLAALCYAAVLVAQLGFQSRRKEIIVQP
jgi:predicted membrane-bound spermidine synthase